MVQLERDYNMQSKTSGIALLSALSTFALSISGKASSAIPQINSHAATATTMWKVSSKVLLNNDVTSAEKKDYLTALNTYTSAIEQKAKTYDYGEAPRMTELADVQKKAHAQFGNGHADPAFTGKEQPGQKTLAVA
jgi:hypothetical protein